MRRFLSDLICDDLAELANYGSDVVASEEAIRCMVALYKNQKNLHNVYIVNKDGFYSFLKNQLDIESLKKSLGHYQFLIEVGSRSKAYQRVPETIHYCSVDMYFVPGEQPIAFVADHYRGHDGYYTEFSKIAGEFRIHFAVPGKQIFQADSVHCPIFSINNLLLTAHDKALPELLRNIVDNAPVTHTLFSWNELPPSYVYPSQSVSMLFNYIEHVKSKEKLPAEKASPTLENSPFAKFLPANLYAELTLGAKIRNKSVKTLAAKMAGDVVMALEKTDMFDEDTLIDLCYQEKYPEVYFILKKALEISKKFPLIEKGMVQAHPLFELAFSFAVPLEICFANQNFKDIFADETILELMQKGLLDPHQIFNAMVLIPKEITVNKTICNTVRANLSGIKIIASCLDAHPEINLQNINALLQSKSCTIFFKNTILSELFVKGFLKVNHIDQIPAYKIDQKSFAVLPSDFEKLEYLNEKFNLNLDLNSVWESFVFTVPVINTASKEASIPVEKPMINTALLVKSMSKSIFSTESKRSEETGSNSKIQVHKFMVNS